MSIRRARAQDVPFIEACARAAYELYIERIGREPAPMVADFATHVRENHVYVMSDGRAIAGYVIFYPRTDHLHLENIAVMPKYQGEGFGGRLIAFVEEEAIRLGYAAVELYTNQKMFENLKMYPKLGYVEIDRRVEEGFERVFYRKNLHVG